VRIALTHAFCWPEVRRGAERFVPMLGAALARRGHDVLHITSAWEPGVSEVDGVRLVKLPRRREDTYAHEADFGRRLFGELARRRLDAVHSLGRHDAVASIRAAWLRGDGRRTVITDLGIPDPGWWRTQGRRQAAAASRVVRSIDVYSCMSQMAVDALAANYGRSDGVVVPGGVDLASFAPASERTPHPAILFSGAIDEDRKGVPVLLEALPLLAVDEPEVELWLSGPGSAERFLARAPESTRARVRLLGLGEADRQHERYGRAWVTCLPSIHDSFGMALIESLACGTPLVVTTDGAPQELVDPGRTGELCTPRDPGSLAAAIRRGFALTRRGEPTVRACRARAADFDWDHALAPLCERLYRGGRS
jgi:glycosyltransferase involved in cell wall biosynthesis